ncbi:hypothetical protein LTR95_010275 [Oleoguttula sp. CCFEE 5521]
MNSGAEGIAMDLAGTIQAGHINHSPSVAHDVNPSTASSQKQPVQLNTHAHTDDGLSDVDEDEIPVSMLRPTPRRPQMPPLPDLRFEQSYLASIKDAPDWRMVSYITVRDQIFMPLAQGLVWSLAIQGWRHWNRDTKLAGQTVGAKIRRWWWGVNNWKLPEDKDKKVAEEAKEFFQGPFGNAAMD